MCTGSSRKYPYPHGRDLPYDPFPPLWKLQFSFIHYCKTLHPLWNFQSLLRWRVCIFSGTNTIIEIPCGRVSWNSPVTVKPDVLLMGTLQCCGAMFQY